MTDHRAVHYQMLPKSHLQREAEARRLLKRHGVDADRIICFENVRWDFVTNNDVYDHIPKDEYYPEFTEEFILKFADYLEHLLARTMHNKELTALSDGYLSVDGYVDPMQDAFNMEAGYNGKLYMRLSDAICIIDHAFNELTEEHDLMVSYECAQHVSDYLVLLCKQEKDCTDMYKTGALQAFVKTEKFVKQRKPLFKIDPTTKLGKMVTERMARKAKESKEKKTDKVISFADRRAAFLAKKMAEENTLK